MADEKATSNYDPAKAHETGMIDLHDTLCTLALLSGVETDECAVVNHHTFPEPTRGTSAMVPRANFPLPRELRDQIYGYLLDGKHTRVKRVRLGAPAYKFHTNILAVNRQINQEVEWYLYRNNVFVAFRSHVQRCAGFDMPVVAFGWKKVKHLSLNATFCENYDPHCPPATPHVEHRLLLASDLGIACSLVEVVSHLCVTERVEFMGLSSSDNIREYIERMISEEEPAYLSLTFGSRPPFEATPELQSTLLSHFRSIYRRKTRVRIKGYKGNNHEMHRVKRSLNSTPSCNVELFWKLFWRLEDLKDAADAFAALDELREAISACSLILEVTRCVLIVRPSPVHSLSGIWSAMCQITYDTALTKAHLELKMGESTSFADTVSYMLTSSVMHRLIPPLVYLPHTSHVQMLAVVASEGDPLAPAPRSIEQWVESLLNPNNNEYQLHDAKILQACPDQSKIFTWGDWPNASCSFHQLPPKCVNFRKLDLEVKTSDPNWQ